jgi:hypothetical protein
MVYIKFRAESAMLTKDKHKIGLWRAIGCQRLPWY